MLFLPTNRFSIPHCSSDHWHCLRITTLFRKYCWIILAVVAIYWQNGKPKFIGNKTHTRTHITTMYVQLVLWNCSFFCEHFYLFIALFFPAMTMDHHLTHIVWHWMDFVCWCAFNRAFIHPFAHTHTFLHIYTHARTRAHTHIHTCIHTYIHTYIHTHAVTYIHAYKHIYTHAYINT